jgi:spore coat polysaccharide biosynthesis predicted glycosyltransferase SpsG/CMP-N-acetylneuraminic acid synthetase
MRIVFFIPALTSKARFHDDLLRKLNGTPLIQHAVSRARELGGTNQSIHILTDSEEVALAAKRSEAHVFLQAKLELTFSLDNANLHNYIKRAERDSQISVVLSPYAAVLGIDIFCKARQVFLTEKTDAVIPVRHTSRRVLNDPAEFIWRGFTGISEEHHYVESTAFTLLKPGLFTRSKETSLKTATIEIKDEVFEIETAQGWWVCEKLLKRRRIVFRVIGNKMVGMGHVYRALSLAHELRDHEVLFVTDTDNQEAVEAIIRRDYWLGAYPPGKVIEEIIALRPNLMINDVLNTGKQDIELLKHSGSKVVSFEDLGPGARCTDLTINELYDQPRFSEQNVLWGREYFFLRDEFMLARPNRFAQKVKGIMLAFGGTDQHDLTFRIFEAIRAVCDEYNVHVHIVTGPGYRGYGRLQREVQVNEGVSLTHDSQVISGLMEKVQIAITSNGRTVYEFAHMNVPAIVIAQHERELTHSFASADNGFVPLGLYRSGNTEEETRQALRNLLTNPESRKDLHQRLRSHRFTTNKSRVLRLLNRLLEDAAPSDQLTEAVIR